MPFQTTPCTHFLLLIAPHFLHKYKYITAALTKAEHTILSLQDQLVASSQELSDKAERLSASETEITKLSEQVKELSFKVESFEAAGKEEVSALTSKLEQAQGEVNRLGDKVKSLETAVEEGEWQVEKAEDEKKSLEKQLADMTEGKEAADVTLEGAKDAAAAAFSRVTFLEKQVKQAKSDALTARKTWEEELETKAKELETKAKEVVDTKAKLRHVIENKYSFSALSADLSAWSKKAGAAMKFW